MNYFFNVKIRVSYIYFINIYFRVLDNIFFRKLLLKENKDWDFVDLNGC